MENTEEINTNKFKTIDDCQKKYDLFFGNMVADFNDTYMPSGENKPRQCRNKEGKIKLESGLHGVAKLKSFSVHIVDKESGHIYTEVWLNPVGYEFNIKDESFYTDVGFYTDIGSTDATISRLKKAQKAFEKDPEKQYDIDHKNLVEEYFLNQQLAREKGIDLRHIIVPKMIQRLETAKKVSAKGISGSRQITDDVYREHLKAYGDLDASFKEENYDAFKESEEYYVLNKQGTLKIKGNDVDYGEYNELCAFPKTENEEDQWVLPERIIVNISDLQCTNDDNQNKIIQQLCELNKIYMKDIRILDYSTKKAYLVTAKQFKDIILNDTIIGNCLTDETKKSIDDMVEFFEKKENNLKHKQEDNTIMDEQSVNNNIENEEPQYNKEKANNKKRKKNYVSCTCNII